MVRRAAVLLLGCLLAAACSGPDGSSASDPGAEPSGAGEAAFRIIGYVTDGGVTASEDQVAALTHLNYAFALPQPDGTLLDLANPWKLDAYVQTAHAHGVKVLISVGGWGWDAEFEQLAATPESRGRFVEAVTGLVTEHGLDGADIDWEYPDPGASSTAFSELMSELRAALPPDALLTAAVAALGRNADGVADDVFEQVDFLNLMAYDGGGPQHAPLSYAEETLAYWSARGLPADQSVLGVPFYSRPAEVSYRDLVDADPDAALADEIDFHSVPVNYNGPATIGLKTRLAMERASGLMIWTVTDDTSDETSLLRAIRVALGGG
jgi:GH18 family chitinase